MNSSNTPENNQTPNFLFFEPAPYYDEDHLDDILFEFNHREELLLSRQLQTQLSLTKEEKPMANTTTTTTTKISTEVVNMADLQAQVAAVVSQMERIVSQVQANTKSTTNNIG